MNDKTRKRDPRAPMAMEFFKDQAKRDPRNVNVDLSGGVAASGAVGAAALRKTSDLDNLLKNALLKDLVSKDLNKTEFALELGLKPSTVAWWFTNDHIPPARQFAVIELLGTQSATFEVLLSRAEQYAASEDDDANARGYEMHRRFLLGMKAFNDWLLLDAFRDKNTPLSEVIDGFSERYPEFSSVGEYKRRLLSSAIGEAKGIAALPVAPEIGAKLARQMLAQAGAQPAATIRVKGEAVRTRKFYFGSTSQEESFLKLVDEIDWQSKTRPLPLAKHVRRTGQTRPGLRISTDKALVGVTMPGWAINPKRDGDEEKLPFLSMSRAILLELHLARIEDQANNRHRNYMLVMFDPSELYKENTWYVQLRADAELMGITLICDDELPEIENKLKDWVSKLDTPAPVTPQDYEDDTSVDVF